MILEKESDIKTIIISHRLRYNLRREDIGKLQSVGENDSGNSKTKKQTKKMLNGHHRTIKNSGQGKNKKHIIYDNIKNKTWTFF